MHTRHWTRRLLYTEGVKILADEHGAHWLIDLVASYQPYAHVAAEEFQLWRLVVTPTKSAVVTMTDGNTDKAIVTQRIEFTDFPNDECELYCVRSEGEPAVLMLPGEY